MFRNISFGFLCVLLFSGSNFIYAQQEYEVAVTYVNVWVKAVDGDGNPVEGLKQEDFEIFEDGKPVQLTCFEEVKIAESATAVQKEEEPVSERFVVYLDLLNTTPREYQAIKPGLKQFLEDIARRNAEVMVAGLLPTTKLGIFAPFTKDVSKLRVLLDKAPANKSRDTVIESRHVELRRVMSGGTGDAVDALRDGYQAAKHYAQADRDVSEFTLRALESFATHLFSQNFGGHLIILYVSGGFSSDPGRQYFDEVDSLAEGQVEQEEMLTFAMDRQYNFDFKKEMLKSIGKLNRLNVTISTLDTQGMGSSVEYRESLQQVAAETGGISFGNSQNFKDGLKQILRDFEHQYILCYSPPAVTKSGYRKIKVVTKKPGVKLRHRLGYEE